MTQEKYSSDTENRILKAAKKIFIKNGLSGTRMQNIANEAKINKALLHYYFRSKEKLFDAVFKYAFIKFVPKVEKIRKLLQTDMSFFYVCLSVNMDSETISSFQKCPLRA